MSRKYNMIIDDAVIEGSIEKFHYSHKPRPFDGFSADWCYHNYEISLYISKEVMDRLKHTVEPSPNNSCLPETVESTVSKMSAW